MNDAVCYYYYPLPLSFTAFLTGFSMSSVAGRFSGSIKSDWHNVLVAVCVILCKRRDDKGSIWLVLL